MSASTREVLQRTVEALAPEGRKYVGVLYGGFMLTKELIQTEGKQTCNEKLKTTISWEIYSLCTVSVERLFLAGQSSPFCRMHSYTRPKYSLPSNLSTGF